MSDSNIQPIFKHSQLSNSPMYLMPPLPLLLEQQWYIKSIQMLKDLEKGTCVICLEMVLSVIWIAETAVK